MKLSDLLEGSEERKTNAKWAQITDYEKRAKATKDPIKKDHLMKMAADLRRSLPVNESSDARLDEEIARALDNGDDYLAKQYAKMAATPEERKRYMAMIKKAMYSEPE